VTSRDQYGQGWVLPRLIGWAMRNGDLLAYRRRLIPRARGLVLEIGIGSGLNLPLYGPAVDRIVGLDPSPELLRRAGRLASRSRCPVHLIQASAEAIPARTVPLIRWSSPGPCAACRTRSLR